MSDRPSLCEDRDGIICDGINDVKNIVEGFAGDGGRATALPTASDSVAPQPTPPRPDSVTSSPEEAGDETPPPPPPPPAPAIVTTSSPPETVTVSVASPTNAFTPAAPPPSSPEMALSAPQDPNANIPAQPILPTSVLLTSTSSRGSFIESLPTRTATTLNPVNNPLVPSIFASSDFQAPVVGLTTTFPSPTDTVVETPLVSPGPAQGAIVDRSTTFPAALVAGVSGGVVAFIFIFALIWRQYLRTISQRQHARSVADEKGTIHNEHGHRGPPSDRVVTTQIWAGSQPSKSGPSRFSWATTEVSLGTELELLSPKPVIQQTVHRMSVPIPVEASSFRNSSKEGSMRASFSRLSSTSPQPASTNTSVPEETESRHASLARLQSPGTDHSAKQLDPSLKPELTEEDHELMAVPAPLQTKRDGTGLQRQYTLRTSPLHQNPFRDPIEEESPVGIPSSLKFDIVSTDASSSKSSSESPTEGKDTDSSERRFSQMHVLETITLTTEDLMRASTAKTIASTRTRREE